MQDRKLRVVGERYYRSPFDCWGNTAATNRLEKTIVVSPGELHLFAHPIAMTFSLPPDRLLDNLPQRRSPVLETKAMIGQPDMHARPYLPSSSASASLCQDMGISVRDVRVEGT